MRPFRVDSNGMRKGVWSKEEDHKLRAYIHRYGHWNWRLLPKYAGLERCGKSCRLRWVNYLKPGVKKGNFSKEEEDVIIQLHAKLGNKWSAIALEFPGRTDNDIKNYWHSQIRKRRKREATEAEMTTKDESRVEVDQELSSQISPSDNIVESELENLFPSVTDNPINCVAIDHTSSSDSEVEQDFWSQPCQIDYFKSSNQLEYGELSTMNPYTLSPLFWPEEDSFSSSGAFREFRGINSWTDEL